MKPRTAYDWEAVLAVALYDLEGPWPDHPPLTDAYLELEPLPPITDVRLLGVEVQRARLFLESLQTAALPSPRTAPSPPPPL